ncbi:MAG: hypothetical protein GF331_20855, partial [Chitinivibrionales bacterium]|nr:hypothetical protein [Chitinivibrionales bacterium]
MSRSYSTVSRAISCSPWRGTTAGRTTPHAGTSVTRTRSSTCSSRISGTPRRGVMSSACCRITGRTTDWLVWKVTRGTPRCVSGDTFRERAGRPRLRRCQGRTTMCVPGHVQRWGTRKGSGSLVRTAASYNLRGMVKYFGPLSRPAWCAGISIMLQREVAMKTITACALVFAGCVSVAAQDVVDSIVYDEGMEWKVFSTEGPALRFAVQGGTLWMATAEKVVTVNTKTNSIRNFSTLGSMPASGVQAMTTDPRGRVWIGTADGLAMATGSGFTLFTEENGLCNNSVKVIHGAADGSVWVGTDNGLCVYKDGAWQTFTKENGLRGNQVKAIEDGQGGALWIGTN